MALHTAQGVYAIGRVRRRRPGVEVGLVETSATRGGRCGLAAAELSSQETGSPLHSIGRGTTPGIGKLPVDTRRVDPCLTPLLLNLVQWNTLTHGSTAA